MTSLHEPDPRSSLYPPPGVPVTDKPGMAATVRVAGRGFTTVGLTLAAVGLVLPLAALLGIGAAAVGQSRGDSWARPTMIIAAFSFMGGIAIAALATEIDPDVFGVIWP